MIDLELLERCTEVSYLKYLKCAECGHKELVKEDSKKAYHDSEWFCSVDCETNAAEKEKENEKN